VAEPPREGILRGDAEQGCGIGRRLARRRHVSQTVGRGVWLVSVTLV
jgi:hypothetical protein